MLAQLLSVSRYYSQNQPPVLNSVSLDIEPADSIAITGPSGSGKSTLLNILGTLDKPSSGTVIIDGKNTCTLVKKQEDLLRNRFVGFVFQKHNLLPQLTFLENVLLPTLADKMSSDRNEKKERALMLMERVGLKDMINKFPGKASVGECQRAAVVRALINKPSLLLADEPTGSLDNDNALRMGQLLADLNKEQGVAIVVVTHSVEIASRMDRIFKLHSGKLELVK